MFAGALTGGSQAAAFLLLLIAPQVTLIDIYIPSMGALYN